MKRTFCTIYITFFSFFRMDDDENPPDLFIGLDFSTQQIKAVVINIELQVNYNVLFNIELQVN